MRTIRFLIAILATSLPALAQSGKIAFISAEQNYIPQAFVMNADGSGKQQITREPNQVRSVAWSPDGSKMAYLFDTQADDSNQLIVINADGSNRRVVTSQASGTIAWSPDGQKIAFASGLQGKIMTVNVDGTQKAQYQTAAGAVDSWAPGPDLIWQRSGSNSSVQIMRNATPISLASGNAYNASEAADGRLAFVTDTYNLVVTDANGQNGRVVASNADAPAWSADGLFLAFEDPNNGAGAPTPISVVKADGSGLRAISMAPGGSMRYGAPSWQGAGASAPTDDTQLHVNNNRYKVTLSARDQRTGKTGTGKANLQTNVFGYFSIPDLTGDAANPEVFVKVLGPVGDSPWVFFGGLTDVEYTLTVTDGSTGQVRSYHKDPGTPKGGYDTGGGQGPAGDCPLNQITEFTTTPFRCSATDSTLCLLSNRFAVTLAARDQRSGNRANGVTLAKNDLFGFFRLPELTGDPTNVEVFVKMLDGRSLGGKYWVFFGGLTDFEYTLLVRDTVTGKNRMYVKPAGSACGGFDTSAF